MEGKEKIRTSDRLLDLYSHMLIEIWEVVSALIGEAVLTLLFRLAIQKGGERDSFLNSIKVSEDGISLEEMIGKCQKLSPLEIHRGFQGLLNHLFNLFSALTEGVLSREIFPKVFPKLKEAERILSQK
ncbi:MAG: hypothetical protein ACUVTN_11260 [Thermodesulfobacteriota bacterium]